MLKNYIAFDLETTGLSPGEDEILEIGALKVRDGHVTGRFMEFVRPQSPVTPFITGLTGITDEMVRKARTKEEVLPDFLTFCEEDVLIGHNVMFDYKFICINAERLGLSFAKKRGIDTLRIAQRVHSALPSKSLENLCCHYQIENKSAHRAYHDALATAKLYQTMAHYFEEKEPAVFEPFLFTGTKTKPQPATPRQMSYLLQLARQNKVEVTWDTENLTRQEASRLIERMKPHL